MAKINAIFGKMSGKLGGSVFAIYNGEQVIREYNPSPSNPKSLLQLQQRAKGNLVGRVSSFTPKEAINGLGNNARRRRAEFLRNLLKAAQVQQVDGEYTAKLSDEDIVFSKGVVPQSVFLSSIAATATAVTATLHSIGGITTTPDEYAAYQTRLVLMVYRASDLALSQVITKIATKPALDGTAITTFSVLENGSYIAVLYAVPMSTADGSAISISTNNVLRDDSDIAAELSANRAAVVFEYGRSVVLGTVNYTANAKEIDAAGE